MRASSRRKLDVVLLGVGVAATGAVAVVGGIAGDTERVAGMWVGASLGGDGRAAVTELIDYDFGLQDRHGIFRTIPGLTVESPVSVASASAPDGIAQVTTDVSGDEPGIKLKIGDPNVTINGQHRYRIEYRHDGLVDGAGTLRWDAVGTGWEVPVEQTEVHVVAPWSFDSPTCSKGATGTAGGCELEQREPGHLVATVGRLDSGEGITVTARRGGPPPRPPSRAWGPPR